MFASTLNPVLERELRHKARSWTTFAFRAGAAAVSLVVCMQQLKVVAPLRTPAALGRLVFDVLVAAAFLLSCSGCLISSDAIATERREGTLGLLLLTSVRGDDVILGKLASSGLTSLSAVVAFLPSMMIPLLAGGVTGAEAARKGVALVAILWFALAAGFYGASAEPIPRRVSRAALFILGLFVLVPFLSFAAGASGFWRYAGLPSPLVMVVAAGDSVYGVDPHYFWVSGLTVSGIGWLLFLALGVIPLVPDIILVVFYASLLTLTSERLTKALSPEAGGSLRLVRLMN